MTAVCSALRARLASFDFSYVYAFLGEASLAVTFGFYVLLARVLGPESYGVFSAAVALGGILGVLIQYGLPVLLTRNVASDPEGGPGTAPAYLVMQGLNTVPVLLVMPVLISGLGFAGEGVWLCWLVIFAELFRSMKMLLRGVFKGRGWFRGESVSVTLERVWVAGISVAVLFTTRNPVWVLLAFVVARGVDVLVVSGFLSRKVKLWRRVEGGCLREGYRKGWPFAVHGILWILYYQVDMIMLKAMGPELDVGHYGAAYRVMEIFSALPRVVFYVAFTRFAQCYAEEPGQMPKRVMEAVRVLMLLVLPALVVAGLVQPWVMGWLFGEAFGPSVLLLAVLLPGLGVKMFSTLSEEYLLATGREKTLPLLLGVVAVSNIGVNALLIPRYGALGAAMATVFSEVVFCLLGLRLAFRHGLGGLRGKLLGLLAISAVTACLPLWVIF